MMNGGESSGKLPGVPGDVSDVPADGGPSTSGISVYLASSVSSFKEAENPMELPNRVTKVSFSTNESMVVLHEHAPSTAVIRESSDGDDQSMMTRAWNIFGIPGIRSRIAMKEKHKQKANIPRNVKSYYRRMDTLLAGYAETAQKNSKPRDDEPIGSGSEYKKVLILAKVSFAVNLALLILKGVAAGLSGSLSVISSLVDSVMDLISGIIIWLTSSAIKVSSPYLYPLGKTRLEPVALVVLSAVMAVASVQLVAESIQTIIAISSNNYQSTIFDNVTLSVLSVTMLSKVILWIFCRGSDSSSVQALSLDHRNDVLANAVAALCGYFGNRYWPYLDPIGAIIIGIYILANWWQQGAEQVKLLTGYTANPDFLSQITWVALQHDERIQQIDTVRAYHFGNDFIVEVHIVLPDHFSLKEAHDIGEPLQTKLEAIPGVERAFVHIDYESEHPPEIEHKKV